MPVGTQGSVKAMTPRDLVEAGARIILGNTYHLYLRPGMEIIRQAGGLHRFMQWKGPLLTDSGGYQVFSLQDLRGVNDDGVEFKSHIDGSIHVFTPEHVIAVQRTFGSDIMMVLDECPPFPCQEDAAGIAVERTHRWALRCGDAATKSDPPYGKSQALFGIVQGSTFENLRVRSAERLVGLEFDGYAIGGLSVGEPAAAMYAMTDVCTSILPDRKPRYLMGVGTPENILEAIQRGVDMFDCVLPTRNGRNALFFTHRGKLNIRNAQYATDFRQVDDECSCYACRNFTRGYIRHLFKAGEILGLHLATLHNLTFYLWLVTRAREAITADRFEEWKTALLGALAAEPSSTDS